MSADHEVKAEYKIGSIIIASAHFQFAIELLLGGECGRASLNSIFNNSAKSSFVRVNIVRDDLRNRIACQGVNNRRRHTHIPAVA